MVPKKSQINSHLLFTHLQLIFQLSLRSFTHAKASPHWLILKSDNVFSIDMILISTHRPFSDRYIVSIGTSDNNLKLKTKYVFTIFKIQITIDFFALSVEALYGFTEKKTRMV